MEIKFEFDINDWMGFQMHFLETSKQFKRSKIIVTYMLPAAFSIIILFDILRGKLNIVGIAIFGIISLLWVLIYPQRMTERARKRVRGIIEDGDNSSILGQHRIIFSDEGINHIEPESEQKMKWSGIKKFEENDDFYFLYNTSVSAIIIPKKKIDVDINSLDELLKSNLIQKKN